MTSCWCAANLVSYNKAFGKDCNFATLLYFVFVPIKVLTSLANIYNIIKENALNKLKQSKRVIQYDDEGNAIENEDAKSERQKYPIPVGFNNMRELL